MGWEANGKNTTDTQKYTGTNTTLDVVELSIIPEVILSFFCLLCLPISFFSRSSPFFNVLCQGSGESRIHHTAIRPTASVVAIPPLVAAQLVSLK